jgi:hypothetical protein
VNNQHKNVGTRPKATFKYVFHAGSIVMHDPATGGVTRARRNYGLLRADGATGRVPLSRRDKNYLLRDSVG